MIEYIQEEIEMLEQLAEKVAAIIDYAWSILDDTEVDAVSYNFDDDKGHDITIKMEDYDEEDSEGK